MRLNEIPNIKRFFLSDVILCLPRLRESYSLIHFKFLISIHENFKMNDQSIWCLFNKLHFSLVIPSSLVFGLVMNFSKKGNLFHVMVRFSINFFFRLLFVVVTEMNAKMNKNWAEKINNTMFKYDDEMFKRHIETSIETSIMTLLERSARIPFNAFNDRKRLWICSKGNSWIKFD